MCLPEVPIVTLLISKKLLLPLVYMCVRSTVINYPGHFFFFFYFTILYWFCHTSTCIRHGCTHVPHPEPPSHLPPHTIPLGHPSTPAPSFLYPAFGLPVCFLHDIIHVLMPFSQIIPSPTESKRLFYTSVSLLLSRIQGCRYHLSKFHIYVLVYCIGVYSHERHQR